MLVLLPFQHKHGLGVCQEPFVPCPEKSTFLIKVDCKVVSKNYIAAVV